MHSVGHGVADMSRAHGDRDSEKPPSKGREDKDDGNGNKMTGFHGVMEV
jgi:hypothetical protein